MIMERWWDETDRGEARYLKESQCHFAHHKSHADKPGSNLSRRGEKPMTVRPKFV
jgi:hypothetical protein